MPLQLNDDTCLRPRLLDRPGRPVRRINGVLRHPDARDAPRFIDAVEHDGQHVRYRALADDGSHHLWLVGGAHDDYRSCSQSIVARLRTLARDEDGPLSVVDSAVTLSGRIWIAVRHAERRNTRWIPVSAWPDQKRASP